MFDPYHKWLGIPREKQPPTHYALLGLEPGESDPEVIEAAALRQSAHLRGYQIGPHAGACSQLLNEVAQAKTTLANPAKRQAYDARLASEEAMRRDMEREAARQAVTAQKPPQKPVAARRPPPVDPIDADDEDDSRARRQRRERRHDLDRAGSRMTFAVFAGIFLVLVVPFGIVGGLYYVLVHRGQNAAANGGVVVKVQDDPVAPANIAPGGVVPDPRVAKPNPQARGAPPQEVKPAPANDPAPLVNPNQPPPAIPASLANIEKAIGRQIVHGVAVSPDGQSLVTSMEGKGTWQWDLAKGTEVRQLTADRSNNLRFTGDAAALLHANIDTNRSILMAWNPKDGRELKRIDPAGNLLIGASAWSPDAKWLLAAGNDAHLHLWNVDTGQESKWPSGNDTVESVAFVSNSFAITGDKEGALHFWELPAGRRTKQLPHGQGPNRMITSLLASKTGKWALVGCRDNTLKILDLATDQVQHVFRGHAGDVCAIALSRDEGLAATSDDNGKVIVWDLRARQPLRTRTWETIGIRSMQFLPGDRHLVTGGGGGVHFWDWAADKGG
jgi:hypothetical protein